MKKHGKHIVTLMLVLLAGFAFGQQLENSSFEEWEDVKRTQEPVGWNTIMTGDLCRFCSLLASQRSFPDSEEFVDGKRSIRIESRSILGGIIFNGSVTTGRIAVPSASASAGYNQTRRNESGFNQQLTSSPDSLVFWAKYNITDNSDSALVAFLVHGDTDLKVPITDGQETAVVSSIRKTFHTGGTWKRISIPFQYNASDVEPAYVLATFSSSFVAGKGNGDAKLWIDKVDLVYSNKRLSLDAK